eukprot:CAMPEP_0172554214 /NCGR_PEP_ID=MMETSP1067-20121228/53693_1 /TAXON_ID=265564 ORGANISM="Thalassiosira punctigera, Strain Tpunct2005C2" /NCGR_SAMPLE_ID=MMETSP1067 /ASSEMBLY_ACC=CAM_ASM_000444 /LENGTH=56 /DNA_ID=CAMNT_0013342541 /DNA_START=47 /DNA_END=214 /DNA_ORIENTATION=+
MANNDKVQSGVTDILGKYGVAENRIYVDFFDMPEGWRGVQSGHIGRVRVMMMRALR